MHRFLLSSTLTLVLLAAGPAAAQLAATHIEEGQILYFGADIEWAKVNLPRTLNFIGIGGGRSSSASSPIDGQNQVEGWGAGGGFGFVLPPEKVDLGRNLRIEVSGGVFEGDSKAGHGVPAGTYTWEQAADGSNKENSIWCCDSTIITKLDYETWNVDLLVRTDFGDPEGVVLSPFFGTTYTRENRWDKYRQRVAAPASPTSGNTVDQEMNTDYAGIALGGTVSLPLFGAARVALTGRADLTGADTEVTSKQVGFTGPSGYVVRAKDKLFRFSANLGGSAGLNVPIGPLLLVAEGFGSWRSWAPQAAYASPRSGTSPLRLTGDTLWYWGGRARVEFVF